MASDIVLIVDDCKVDRVMVRSTVERMLPDSQIVEADSPGEAARLVEQHKPRLIVADVCYLHAAIKSLADGYELCQWIKGKIPDVVVVLVTGSFAAVSTECAERCGADAFEIKSSSMQELARALESLLQKR